MREGERERGGGEDETERERGEGGDSRNWEEGRESSGRKREKREAEGRSELEKDSACICLENVYSTQKKSMYIINTFLF
jgi:hypothetical protein